MSKKGMKTHLYDIILRKTGPVFVSISVEESEKLLLRVRRLCESLNEP